MCSSSLRVQAPREGVSHSAGTEGTPGDQAPGLEPFCSQSSQRGLEPKHLSTSCGRSRIPSPGQCPWELLMSTALVSLPISSGQFGFCWKEPPRGGGWSAVSLAQFCSQSRSRVQPAEGRVLVGEPVPGRKLRRHGPGPRPRVSVEPAVLPPRSELHPLARAFMDLEVCAGVI